MKRFMLAVTVLILMASCDITFIEPRYDHYDQVTGYYDIEEYSETFNDYTYYTLRITRESSGSGTVYLHNFYGANLTVRAYLNYNKLTIPYQVVGGYEVEGTGSVNHDHIDLSYRVKDLYHNSIADFCNTYGERDY